MCLTEVFSVIAQTSTGEWAQYILISISEFQGSLVCVCGGLGGGDKGAWQRKIAYFSPTPGIPASWIPRPVRQWLKCFSSLFPEAPHTSKRKLSHRLTSSFWHSCLLDSCLDFSFLWLLEMLNLISRDIFNTLSVRAECSIDPCLNLTQGI